MNVLISNNGDMYSKTEFEDYLSTLGFDPREVARFIHDDEYESLEQNLKWSYAKEDELEEINDELNSRMQMGADEIEAVAKILCGKGGLTRQQAANRLYKIVNDYLYC